jgi:hypothetical protein
MLAVRPDRAISDSRLAPDASLETSGWGRDRICVMQTGLLLPSVFRVEEQKKLEPDEL